MEKYNASRVNAIHILFQSICHYFTSITLHLEIWFYCKRSLISS